MLDTPPPCPVPVIPSVIAQRRRASQRFPVPVNGYLLTAHARQRVSDVSPASPGRRRVPIPWHPVGGTQVGYGVVLPGWVPLCREHGAVSCSERRRAGMGKAARARSTRVAKRRRRQQRQEKASRRAPFLGLGFEVPPGFAGGGWHHIDDLDDVDLTLPDEALMDASCCPLGAACAGCSSTEHLRVVTSALSRPGGFEVACATLCHDCDGRSFLHLLTPEAFERAVEAHARHSQPDQGRGQR